MGPPTGHGPAADLGGAGTRRPPAPTPPTHPIPTPEQRALFGGCLPAQPLVTDRRFVVHAPRKGTHSPPAAAPGALRPALAAQTCKAEDRTAGGARGEWGTARSQAQSRTAGAAEALRWLGLPHAGPACTHARRCGCSPSGVIAMVESLSSKLSEQTTGSPALHCRGRGAYPVSTHSPALHRPLSGGGCPGSGLCSCAAAAPECGGGGGGRRTLPDRQRLVHYLEHGQREGARLAASCLGCRHHVAAAQDEGHDLGLDWRRQPARHAHAHAITIQRAASKHDEQDEACTSQAGARDSRISRPSQVLNRLDQLRADAQLFKRRHGSSCTRSPMHA
jgi:hypothetical protein